MKLLQKVTAVIAMLAFVMALLLTSFQVAIYGDPEYKFYQKEFEKYHVADSLSMTMEDIMDVNDQMMDYLIGKKEELSVITNVDGKEQDFFNEQDRFHMGEVKDLFLGGLKLRNYLAGLALILCLLLLTWKTPVLKLIPIAYFAALAIFLIFSVTCGGLFASDFNKYFTIFHEIFFDNDLWLFDPRTDYMIRLLPEGFFFDFVFRIGKFFLLHLAGYGVLAGLMLRISGKKEKKTA